MNTMLHTASNSYKQLSVVLNNNHNYEKKRKKKGQSKCFNQSDSRYLRWEILTANGRMWHPVMLRWGQSRQCDACCEIILWHYSTCDEGSRCCRLAVSWLARCVCHNLHYWGNVLPQDSSTCSLSQVVAEPVFFPPLWHVVWALPSLRP